MKKQSIQIALAIAGIGVAVYVYLQSKKKQKLVASPADKPGSPYYTATGASSPAGLAAGGPQTTTALQQPTGTAKNPGGTKPDVWGQAAGAVGSLLGGLFGKNKSGASGGGQKLGSGLGSNYKGPGSITGRNNAEGDAASISKVNVGDSLQNEFGENPGDFRASEGEYGTEDNSLNPNYEHSDYVPEYSGGDNNGDGATDFLGYGGNDGINSGGGDFEGGGAEFAGGGSTEDFELD